jgi:hypothetical protein
MLGYLIKHKKNIRKGVKMIELKVVTIVKNEYGMEVETGQAILSRINGKDWLVDFQIFNLDESPEDATVTRDLNICSTIIHLIETYNKEDIKILPQETMKEFDFWGIQ